MMRIRLDINGRDIAEIGVHNTGVRSNSGTVYDVYDLRGMEEGETLENALCVGSVTHRRQSGAASLAAKVMDEVIEEDHLQ